MDKPVQVMKRPIDVAAIQWTGDNIEAIQELCGVFRFTEKEEGRRYQVFDVPSCGTYILGGVSVSAHLYNTLRATWLHVSTGDWIIESEQGGFYPCKDDEFRETYDIVS